MTECDLQWLLTSEWCVCQEPVEEMGLYEDVSGASVQVTATPGGQTVHLLINRRNKINYQRWKNSAQTLPLCA